MASTGVNENSVDISLQNNVDGGQVNMGLQFSRMLRWLGADIIFSGNGSAVAYFPTGTATLLSTQPNEFPGLMPQLTSATGSVNMIVENSQDANKKYYMSLANLFASPLLANATYTPSVGATTNVASSSVTSNWVYWRLGSLVIVLGQYAMAPTASATLTAIEFNPPIPVVWSSNFDAVGIVGQVVDNASPGTLFAQSSTNALRVINFPTTTTSRTYRLLAAYHIP